MTQGERIVEYIKKYGSITPMQAFYNLGVTKLATRISEMTKEGIEFERKMISANNRFGEPVRYMMYFLKDTEEKAREVYAMCDSEETGAIKGFLERKHNVK